MIREALAYPLGRNDPIKTLLIGGFLLATGTVLSLVFVLGYLVRVLAPDTAQGPAPLFDQWRTLASDGVRALIVWTVYIAIPLFILVLWIELYVSTRATSAPFTPFDQQLLNLFVHGLGVGVGGPIAFRPVVQTGYDLAAIGGVLANGVPLLAAASTEALVRYLGVFYGVSLLVCVYLFPIGLTNFAVKRTLRSAFEIGTLKKAALSRTYAIGWGCAVVFLLVGAAGPILWNEWRLAAVGADWGLLHIGFIPVIAHPTPTGVRSVGFLVLASFANFYLLVVGYALLGSILRPLVTDHTARPHTTVRDPEDARR